MAERYFSGKQAISSSSTSRRSLPDRSVIRATSGRHSAVKVAAASRAAAYAGRPRRKRSRFGVAGRPTLPDRF
jgi:hypothetical protein